MNPNPGPITHNSASSIDEDGPGLWNVQHLLARIIQLNSLIHFTSVGEKYHLNSDDITPDFTKLHTFVDGRKQESHYVDFKIPLMSDKFVFDQFRKMSNSKSTGSDGICN